jgi:hypothetical protein
MNFNEQLEQLYNTFKQVVEEKNELVIKNQELEVELENAIKKLEASKTFELQNWSLLKQSSKNDGIIDLQEISNFLKFIQDKAKFFDETIRSNTKNSSHIDNKTNESLGKMEQRKDDFHDTFDKQNFENKTQEQQQESTENDREDNLSLIEVANDGEEDDGQGIEVLNKLKSPNKVDDRPIIIIKSKKRGLQVSMNGSEVNRQVKKVKNEDLVLDENEDKENEPYYRHSRLTKKNLAKN